jgi:hypothetical protein
MEMNPHWRPQYHQTLQSSIAYDFVGRYENFAADFSNVMSRTGGEVGYGPGTEARHKTDANRKVKDFYTASLLKKVRQLYEPDFAHFGYGEI